MSVSQNDRRPLSGNRYNFDQPSFDSPESDWRIPDPSVYARPNGQPPTPHLSDEEQAHWHQPAPMKKRDNPSGPKRKSKAAGTSWMAIAAVALIGLASFVFVIDLAGGGKLQKFIFSHQTATEIVDLNQNNLSAELATPETQKIAETPKPEPLAEIETPQIAKEPIEVVTSAPQLPAAIETPPPPVAPIALPQEQPKDVVEVVAPAPAPVQRQGEVIQDCADCPELVTVSAGSFSLKAEADTKDPAQLIKIDHDFAIGRNVITFADWEICVNQGSCKAVENDAGWGRGNHPLIFVSYDDVTSQYLPWLAKLTGKTYRLPTREEWQYALLGGREAPAAGGLAHDDCFNASGSPFANCLDSFNGTAPVGSFPANKLGLNDMKGNVWVWSADCWQPFTYAPKAKTQDCAMRVVLGGAWSSNRTKVTPQALGWEKSSKQANSIGFRIVRTLP